MRFTKAILFAAGVSASAQSDSAPSGTTTTVSIRHFTGVAQFLGTIPKYIKQFDGAPYLAKLAPTAGKYLAAALPPQIQTIQQLGSSLALVLPSLYITGLGSIPSGVLDAPEYQVALVDGQQVEDFVAGAAINVLAVFPKDLAISDLGSFVSASSDAVYSSIVNVALSALPAAQTLLVNLEQQAYPNGIPSDSSCTPTVGSSPGAAPTVFPSGVAAPTGTFTSGGSSSNNSASSFPSQPAIATGAASGLTISRGVIGSAVLASTVGMLAALL